MAKRVVHRLHGIGYKRSDQQPLVRDYSFSEPLKFIVNAEGVKTAVVISIEEFELMLDHMKALAYAIVASAEESISKEDLSKLFSDYGVLRA